MLRALLNQAPAGGFGAGVAGREKPIIPGAGIGITTGPVNTKPNNLATTPMSAIVSRATNVGVVSFSWKIVPVAPNSILASDIVGGLIDTTANITDGFYSTTLVFSLAAGSPPTDVPKNGKLVIYAPVGTVIDGTSEAAFSILPDVIVVQPPGDPDITFTTPPGFVTVSPDRAVSTHLRFERSGDLSVDSSVRATIQGTGTNPITGSDGNPLFEQGIITFPPTTDFFAADISFPAQDPPAQKATASYTLDTFVRCRPVGPMSFPFGVNAAPVKGGDNPSGLPWLSGWTSADGAATDAFAKWRGRKLDLHYLSSNRAGPFSTLISTMGAAFRRDQFAVAYARDMWVQQTIPLFPAQAELGGYSTQHEAAANGVYDDYHLTMAKALRAYPRRGKLIIRLAHECGSASQKDAYVNDKSPGFRDFKNGWARVADVYHTALESYGGALMDWNNIRNGPNPGAAYPGGGAVDLITTDIYCNTGAGHINNVADWNAFAKRGTSANPAGPITWADFADSRGKKFAIPEWGVTSYAPYDPPNVYDHPAYIEGMWDFYHDLGNLLTYEAYFNHIDDQGHDHVIWPDSKINNPLASAKYKELWKP